MQAIVAARRLAEDTAIATVLATLFAAGMVLLSWVQGLPVGGQAGLERFLLGSTAGMPRSEAELVAALAALLVLVTVLLLKELRLLCFDPGFGEGHGLPAGRLDLLLLGLLLGLLLARPVVGLQVVGLVLAVASVIVPAATARLRAERLGTLLLLAAVVGAVSACLGAALSAVVPRLPTGATVVLVPAALFLAGLMGAPRHGLVAVALRRARPPRRLSAPPARTAGPVP